MASKGGQATTGFLGSEPKCYEPATRGVLLRTLVSRSRTLDELISEGTRPAAPNDLSDQACRAARELLARWRSLVAGGDADAFCRRLSWDGLEQEQLEGVFTKALSRHTESKEPRSEIGWVALVEDALSRPRGEAERGESGRLAQDLAAAEASRRLVWPEVWLPVLAAARRRLTAAVPTLDSFCGAFAQRDLDHHLLSSMDAVAGGLLWDHFQSWRRRFEESETEFSGNESHPGFPDHMRAGGLQEFLSEFPALARLVGRLAETWCDTISEFCHRLGADLPEISERFAAGSHPGRVVRIEPGLSDRHDGGRQVWSLAFESGLKLIYKPRDVGMELSWNILLGELARLGLDATPPAVTVLAGDGYGWMEYVHQTAANDHDEAARYFRTAGALLCLSYLLRANDLHMGNLVAGPAGPVLVDAETLMQPVSAGGASQEHEHCTAGGLVSVLQFRPDGGVHDVGGLAGRGGFQLSTSARRIRRDEEQAPVLEEVPATAPAGTNVLLLGRVPCRPDQFRDELVAGFRDSWRLISGHRRTLIDPGGVLDAFLPCSTRLVVRPSHLYGWLLQRSLVPAYLAEGAARSCFLDVINRVPAGVQDAPRLWPLAALERRALEDLDIPRFQVPVSAEEPIPGNSQTRGNRFLHSGFSAVRNRICGISEEELHRQVKAIDLCLATSVLASGDAAAETVPQGCFSRAEGTGAAQGFQPADSLVALARDLADEVIHRTGCDAPAPENGADPDGDPLLPWYLYEGLTGRSLFLAALGAVTGESEYRSRAWGWCAGLAAAAADGRLTRPSAQIPLGTCHGLGGIIYAATVTGWLLEDERFLHLARSIADLITPDRIAGDNRLDVEGGCSGAALGLLALADAADDQAYADRAVLCGRRLLAAQRPLAAGGAGWQGTDGEVLTGFAHGLAGCGSVLSRIAVVTGDPEFADGARQAVRNLEAVHEDGWPVRPPGALNPVPMSAWCHGAPGIALGLATASPALAQEFHRVLDHAVALTRRAPVPGADHLCCGSFGIADILFTIGSQHGKGELVEAAKGRIALAVQRACCLTNQGFQLTARDSGRPGFFRGLAGIGYSVLRLVRPDLLPSILSFQSPAHMAVTNQRPVTMNSGHPQKEAS